MAVDVDASDAARAMRDLVAVTDRIGEAAVDAGRSHAARILDLVAGRVPYRTGRLAGSLGLFSADGGGEVGYDSSAPYAGWIEFGGSRGRPHVSEGRYLYPTADVSEQVFAAAADDAAVRAIDRYPWS